MSRPTEAQHRDAKTPLVLGSPDFADVQHYLAVARRMRAQAIAKMAAKAVGALARMFRIRPAGRPGTPHAA